jgi:glutathione peroxidase
MASVLDFTMKDIRGREKHLADYKGKVLLLVNVASRCGLTPQYEGLQALFDKYKDRGFMILGFPANNFLWQEPGSDEQIAEFCDTKFGVTFDMFSKIDVKGKSQHPLYKFLTKESEHPGAIKWNFHKFLVDRSGKVVANIDPKTEPKALEKQIEELL